MKAIVYQTYGSPDVLQLKEVDKPVPKNNEVLIKVYATTVNRTDNATTKAIPFFARIITGLFKPKKQTPGTEFAGIIEETGKEVTTFKVGDKVFGFDEQGSGSHAQFMTMNENKGVIAMPDDLSFEQAAASVEGAFYAYNFINKIDLKPGQKVLVNGATGGIGSSAVQLLKHFEADVTAVCGTQNIDLVKSIGANRVLDYLKEDFTKDEAKYNYVFDTVGKSSFGKCMRILLPGGIYISSDLGYMSQNIFLPLITPIIKPLIKNKKTIFPMPVDLKGFMELIKQLIEKGEFKAVIDREYSFEQIVEAYRYVEKGEKIGNVVITVTN